MLFWVLKVYQNPVQELGLMFQNNYNGECLLGPTLSVLSHYDNFAGFSVVLSALMIISLHWYIAHGQAKVK